MMVIAIFRSKSLKPPPIPILAHPGLIEGRAERWEFENLILSPSR